MSKKDIGYGPVQCREKNDPGAVETVAVKNTWSPTVTSHDVQRRVTSVTTVSPRTTMARIAPRSRNQGRTPENVTIVCRLDTSAGTARHRGSPRAGEVTKATETVLLMLVVTLVPQMPKWPTRT